MSKRLPPHLRLSSFSTPTIPCAPPSPSAPPSSPGASGRARLRSGWARAWALHRTRSPTQRCASCARRCSSTTSANTASWELGIARRAASPAPRSISRRKTWNLASASFPSISPARSRTRASPRLQGRFARRSAVPTWSTTCSRWASQPTLWAAETTRSRPPSSPSIRRTAVCSTTPSKGGASCSTLRRTPRASTRTSRSLRRTLLPRRSPSSSTTKRPTAATSRGCGISTSRSFRARRVASCLPGASAATTCRCA